MIPILGALAAGGAIASSAVALRRTRQRKIAEKHSRLSVRSAEEAPSERNQALDQANRTLTVSSIALSVTVAGVFTNPLLMLSGLPVGIYVFAPTFRAAWQSLRHERRVTTDVLDATRVTVCLVMGYFGTLALDAWLRSMTQRVLLRTDADFRRMLETHLSEAPATAWTYVDQVEVLSPVTDLAVNDLVRVRAGERMPVDGIVRYGTVWLDEHQVTGVIASIRKDVNEPVLADTQVVMGDAFVEVTAVPDRLSSDVLRERLQESLVTGTVLQTAGESAGRKMAPRMLALAGLMTPFWGPNRAAGFVTTTFGSQMHTLGRYTLQNFIQLAADHQIYILDGQALETINMINTLVIDARLLDDPALREQASAAIDALRMRFQGMPSLSPHPFTVYLMTDTDGTQIQQLTAEIGADDFLIGAAGGGRAALLAALRQGGRLICYVGDGQEDAALTASVLITVAVPAAAGGLTHETVAQGVSVVIIEKDLARLADLLDIGKRFVAKQGFNLAWPLLMDLLDIGTTVFIHFGLIYSISFSYAGLLVSAINARAPLTRYRRAQESAQRKSALPLHTLGPKVD